jgi:hypothetical protein
MMLGELLRSLSTAPDDEISCRCAGNAGRLARLRAAAAAQDESPAAYARRALCLFLETASEEEWATAMGHMRDDAMPGDRLIELAIERKLRQDGA